MIPQRVGHSLYGAQGGRSPAGLKIDEGVHGDAAEPGQFGLAEAQESATFTEHGIEAGILHKNEEYRIVRGVSSEKRKKIHSNEGFT